MTEIKSMDENARPEIEDLKDLKMDGNAFVGGE